MLVMKILTFVLMALAMAGGGKFKVTESTSQEWVGGLQQSGYGTDYMLVMKVKAGFDKLQIDELWVGDLRLPARAVTDLKDMSTKNFKKNDIVYVRAGVTWKPDQDGQMRVVAGEKKDKPVDYKGEGLIGYTYKGKRGYEVITSFKVLEKIIYP
jgi:hypothetical protein